MSKRKWIWTAVAVVIFVLVGLTLRPRPVVVEVATVQRGAMQTTAEGRGETRVRDRFVITAPVAGRIERIELREGDPTHKGETIVRLLPLPLSEAEKRQYSALFDESQAALRAATASMRTAEAVEANARAEMIRAEAMYRNGIASKQVLDSSTKDLEAASHERDAQSGRVAAASAAVEAARAALIALQPLSGTSIEVRSPSDGTVLRIVERSERVVAPGETLAVVGDPNQIEGVIDLLSEDAIAVRPGAAVTIERWGGERPLRARVRTVEPGAFMKVSALGIEEQRVHVIVDFLDRDVRLGDAYRIEGSLVTWTTPSALKVPLSALLRDGPDWAVFRVENNRANLRKIQIAHRNDKEAEVLRGLEDEDIVVLHPPSTFVSGQRVKFELRESGGPVTNVASPDR